MSPRQYLVGLGKPVITLPEIARAIGVGYHALHYRIRDIPEVEKPDTFRAGGTPCMTLDYACDWAERHVAYWAERQAMPKELRGRT